jgi:hypothetical protein
MLQISGPISYMGRYNYDLINEGGSITDIPFSPGDSTNQVFVKLLN